jgi:hypothetical protein
MAGKSSNFANELLKLIFNGTPIANLADNAASSPITNWELSLHTALPTSGQNHNEVTYTGYARVSREQGTSRSESTGRAAGMSRTTWRPHLLWRPPFVTWRGTQTAKHDTLRLSVFVRIRRLDVHVRVIRPSLFARTP